MPRPNCSEAAQLIVPYKMENGTFLWVDGPQMAQVAPTRFRQSFCQEEQQSANREEFPFSRLYVSDDPCMGWLQLTRQCVFLGYLQTVRARWKRTIAPFPSTGAAHAGPHTMVQAQCLACVIRGSQCASRSTTCKTVGNGATQRTPSLYMYASVVFAPE